MQQTRTPPQTKQILNYLLSGKSITPIEALNLFGCFRLGARIWSIKHELGYPVKSEPFRTGTGKIVAKYSIEK